MVRIVSDEVLREKLHGLDKLVEVLDAQGRVIGRFLPCPSPEASKGMECPFSKEELDRREQDTGRTYTTEEVLDRLANLGKS